jgi:hypothetical protein
LRCPRFRQRLLLRSAFALRLRHRQKNAETKRFCSLPRFARDALSQLKMTWRAIGQDARSAPVACQRHASG